MARTPFVSIVIPVRQINDYLIYENFPATNNLDYKKFEVIVLTSEPTKDKVSLEKKYPWLKINLTKQEMRPAEKRNLGVQMSKGEIIAFIDDDAYPDKNWLTNALNLFKKSRFSRVDAVCGPGILPNNTNIWEKIFDEVLKSWGSGVYDYRFIKQKERIIDDYPSMNFLIKKSVFDKIGGFNGNYWPGEDSKLCEDVVYKERGIILYNPNVSVYHHRRTNLNDFIKQHASYGFHRGAFFAHGDRNSRRLTYIVPTLFVLYFAFSILSAVYLFKPNLFFALIYLPLYLYIFGLAHLSFTALTNTKNVFVSILSPIVLFLEHIFYGIMFVKGLLIGLVKKEKIYNE